MKLRFHVVAVTRWGYVLLSSHADRAEARQRVLDKSLRVGATVLRDGNTGKRFTREELAAE